LPLQPDAPRPGIVAGDPATIELVSLLDFLAGWLDADLDYARARLPLYGTYTVDHLRADTTRILQAIKQTNIES
jgi:hypothetical protein